MSASKKIFATLICVLLAVFSISLIGLVNFQIIKQWFEGSGPANIGSIEVSYVSMARFLRDFSSTASGWAPFWYLGFPFHVFYTPLLPFLEFLINKFFDVNLWTSYRFLTGLAYILAPISVFFLGWQLSKKMVGGLLAGILYSVGPTIFYFILPASSGMPFGEVSADKISPDFWDPRRFTILVRWGEGPHLFSLIFVPLVGVFFSRLLERPKFTNLFLTALFLGLAGLTNAIGFFAGILLMLSMAFVKFAISDAHKIKSFILFLGSGALTLGLISFWYNLSFLSTFFREGGSSGGFLLSLFPWGWVVGIGILVFLYSALRRIKHFGIDVSLLWFLVLFSIVAIYYLSAPADESFRRIEVLPQALRYNTEVDLSLSLFLAVLFTSIFRFLGNRVKAIELAGNALGISIAVALVLYIQPFIQTANIAAGQSVDLRNTQEYRISNWFGENVAKDKGERVFVPGNYGFYLNWFTDVGQLRGGLYQASTNFWPDHIYYQLSNGQDSEIASAWLRAINIKYALIATPASTELYKDVKNLNRFESLEKVYEEAGDIIYKVPLKKASLAKPIRFEDLKLLKPPEKADDKGRLFKYIDWVEDSSANVLEFKMVNNNLYKISGEISEGEGILVQMTYDKGFFAKDQKTGKSVSITKDPLGFMVLKPKSTAVDINLSYRKPLNVWFGYFVSLMTFVTTLAVLWYSLLRKRKHEQRIA